MVDILHKFGLPLNISVKGPQIDQVNAIVHWLMLILFIGWGLFFIISLIKFRASRNTGADYTGVRSHISSLLEGAVAVVEILVLFVALAVTVLGMKIVGLILVVALLIIPAVSARFWSEKVDVIFLISAGFGMISGYVGATISAISPSLPTGPIIVLCSFGVFLTSFIFAPQRGILAVALNHHRFQKTVHLTQGLLLVAQGQSIYEPKTHRLLRRLGYVRADGVATEVGNSMAAKTLLNERRWSHWNKLVRDSDQFDDQTVFSLMDIEKKLTQDQINMIDQGLAQKQQGQV